MKKTNLIWVLMFLLAINLVSAEEGCYLYKESMLYCLDLEREEALRDCMIYDDCMFEKVFFEGKSCSDLNMFLECKEVFCKNTCDYEPLGKCWGGEVPAGEEQIWCSSGCCRFEFYEGEFCEFKKNKWLCEVEARNKDVEEFNFEVMGERECREICSRALILEEKITEGLVMEEVAEEEIPPTRPTLTTPLEPVEEEEEGISWIWIVLILFLLLIVFYLLYQKYKPRKREVLVKPKIKKKPWFFIGRKTIKRREERIKKIREERERKRREKERKELFGLFGFGEVKERKLSYVDLLGKVAKAHELRKKRLKKEEDIFKRVEKLIKEREKKKLTEEKAKEIFERLRRIVEKGK